MLDDIAMLEAQLERLEIEGIALQVLAEQIETLANRLSEFEKQLTNGEFNE